MHSKHWSYSYSYSLAMRKILVFKTLSLHKQHLNITIVIVRDEND
jgi:hypothetical protein